MEIAILSLFPDYFRGPFESSILKRAQEKGALSIQQVDIRDFARDKHAKVDDRPYGGGPGMVMMPDPITDAIESVRRKESRVVYLSPQGSPLTAQKARELSKCEHLVLLCGHYEGIDQRVIDREVDEEISIGDYVLTNGCLAAIVVVDATARFLPGVLGHDDAAAEDSFENGLLDCPHYTRPETFRGQKVPEVLLEGNHGKIAAWRREESLRKTEQSRPELFRRYLLTLPSEPVAEELPSGGKRVKTIRLVVHSLKESVRFYKGVLGLRLSGKREQEALFNLNGIQLLLVEGKSQEMEGPRPMFEVEIKRPRDFEAAAKRAVEKNKAHYEVGRRQQGPWETLTLELSDPDGYHWCLSCKQSKELSKESLL